MDDLVPIGKFSRMTRLSIKALRFYDEQGLLAPAWVDPASGYRYYRPAQANRAEAIRILRMVDMPIDEIRAALDEDDPDATAKRLAVHCERLQERLADQERMLRFLERLIERGGTVMPYEVTIKNAPAQTVASLTVHTSLATIGNAIAQAFSTVVGAIGAAGAPPVGAPFIVYTRSSTNTLRATSRSASRFHLSRRRRPVTWCGSTSPGERSPRPPTAVPTRRSGPLITR